LLILTGDGQLAEGLKIMGKLFRRADTGELKEFWPESYSIDTTGQRSTHIESTVSRYFRAADNTRIDLMKDGTYQERWGQVWVAESTLE
jgi:hypothetical protein